ncbi:MULTISPECIES: hypothetical protein [Paenibacillus]|uniref:5-bromo-4-chloroindolyl phosphate hydrolysis protein n=1 Tax=Paenibacillus violae TaxID=3077234 RepID=A0ABU3R8C5_9BACL|nr:MULTISPECIES: hypothetical protein [Paenibacillus]MDU0200525.1 hypothetical protein [Paenibacillus sp. PFR10]MEC0264579.1 hypothetical protein [Paenibacillus anseongense]
MQSKFKVAIGISVLGYVVSLITARFLPGAINLLVPTTFSLGSLILLSRNHSMEVKKLQVPNAASDALPNARSTSSTNLGSETELQGKSESEIDPFWGPIAEYIHVIEETMISEGQKNTLDNEIVEKTLSLLSRVGRLIPQLKELNDANMNHNIQRLIFKDLNGAINPFLKLGGEAKRLNRRLLLTGIKDINSKLSTYVETIEQKDLIELQTRMELIQQRYRSDD